jgi:hypothetical protein
MKVNVEVDCSPEEARAFLGLPDVQPMQEALMKDLEARLRANIQAMDPEVIARTWLPASMQGAEQLQKMFWSQVQQTLAGVASATSGMADLGAAAKSDRRKTASET